MTTTTQIIHLLSQRLRHTQPTELQSTTDCYICHEPFLSGNHPERPITLPCGHIFGEGCILKWISPLSDNEINDRCPLCRGPIIGSMRALTQAANFRTAYSTDQMQCAYLFRSLYMWALADLAYHSPYWLHELSSLTPKTVKIVFGVVAWLLLLVVHESCYESVPRRAATVRASRQLMVAVTGKREVEECMATFENCLCDELPEMLACFWRASRKVVGDVWLGEGMLDFLENVWSKRWSVVRFLVLCRMVFLALWVVFWLCKVYAYGMWHGFERLSFATAKYYADDPRKACFWHDAFCRPEMFERR